MIVNDHRELDHHGGDAHIIDGICHPRFSQIARFAVWSPDEYEKLRHQAKLDVVRVTEEPVALIETTCKACERFVAFFRVASIEDACNEIGLPRDHIEGGTLRVTFTCHPKAGAFVTVHNGKLILVCVKCKHTSVTLPLHTETP